MDYLAKNIRFLRKWNGWSQERMAQELGVKRSSVAAYESKNVRPKFNFVLQLARSFNVSMQELVERDLEAIGGPEKANPYRREKEKKVASGATSNALPFNRMEKGISAFTTNTFRVRKMLEGFKAFYRFKLEQSNDQLSEDARRLQADITNLISLIDHVLLHNDNILQLIGQNSQKNVG